MKFGRKVRDDILGRVDKATQMVGIERASDNM